MKAERGVDGLSGQEEARQRRDREKGAEAGFLACEAWRYAICAHKGPRNGASIRPRLIGVDL
jgi:hypothetical protein